MNVADSEARLIVGLNGNKSLSPMGRKVVSKASKKSEMSPEGSVEGKKRGVVASSPPFSSNGVPSILRRQVSLNASCSSDASTDSFQSRASTGRIYRNSSSVRGRRQMASKPKSVGIDNSSETSPDGLQSKKRCAWVTSSTDQSYATFHDEEWGVPVHDDKKLFELLVLSGALSELTWPVILNKRHLFREVFADFDPIVVGKFSEKRLVGPGSSTATSLLSELKLRAIVENARQISKVIDEFGSFDKYIWSFVNYKPIVSTFRYPRQVAGITNDHLCSCFRFEECISIAESEELGSVKVNVKEDAQKTDEIMESCICSAIEDLNFSS
uniref:Probable GMP synthase [glutamine-hydrolyzing] n=1 Tax=Tanacetum cinerariifolium TaxID=118510 RepID=A0A699GJH6_TANCI|nr:probable GMP synthase [glutamine-hydrolyzing] [Tanacetum cinerariifolium]